MFLFHFSLNFGRCFCFYWTNKRNKRNFKHFLYRIARNTKVSIEIEWTNVNVNRIDEWSIGFGFVSVWSKPYANYLCLVIALHCSKRRKKSVQKRALKENKAVYHCSRLPCLLTQDDLLVLSIYQESRVVYRLRLIWVSFMRAADS